MSGRPGAQVAEVSRQVRPPLSPRLASDAALIKQYFTLIARFFFMWVTLTLTRPNEQLTFGFGELCMFVRM